MSFGTSTEPPDEQVRDWPRGLCHVKGQSARAVKLGRVSVRMLC